MNTGSDRLKGKKYFLDGNLPASIKSFTMALEDEPGSFDVLLGRGAAYLKLGQFDKAIEDLSKVVDGDRHCEKAVFLRGIAHLNACEFEQALLDLNQSLESNTKRGEAILARGLALSMLGNRKEAKKNFTDPYVLNNVIVDEFLEDYAISESLFSKAMELFSINAGDWKLLQTEDEITKMEIVHY